MANNNENALSGGLLAALTIIVALGVGVYFFNSQNAGNPDVTISVDLPNPGNAAPAR